MAKRIVSDDGSSTISCKIGGSGAYDTKRFSVRTKTDGKGVAETQIEYEDCGHDILFINSLAVCPCHGITASVDSITGRLLNAEQMFEECSARFLPERPPIRIWPHLECIKDGRYDRFSAERFLAEVFWDCPDAVSTKLIKSRTGWSDTVLGDMLANGLVHTNAGNGETLVNTWALSAFAAQAWTRLISMDTFQWATRLDIYNHKQDAPIDGFRPATFESTESGVYLLMRDNEVVYVGQSKCVAKRVPSHFQDKQFDRVFYKPVSQSDLIDEERKWIEEFMPVYNRDMATTRARFSTNPAWVAHQKKLKAHNYLKSLAA